MKQKLYFSILICLMGLSVLAQKTPLKKVYAYAQLTLPGKRPSVSPNESGGEIKEKATEKLNYFFYAELKKSAKVKITDIWIKGKKNSVRTDTVSKIPVEITTGDAGATSKKITLEPATGNFFLLMIPSAIVNTEKNISTKISKIISQNELVIRYQWKGKTYYFPVKKIKKLESVASV